MSRRVSIALTIPCVAAFGLLALPGYAVAQDFTAQISPNPVSLTAGGPSLQVAVTTTPGSAFREPITYSFAGLPAGISTGGAQTAVAPYTPITFSFAADASVALGTYTGTLIGTATSGSRTFPVTVVVSQPRMPPVIEAILPPSIVTGTRDNVLRLIGRDFQPGATITSASPGVLVTGATVLDPGTARVVVSVRPDAAPGPYALEVRNPDGGTSAGGASLLVHPAGSLGAPLAVTGVQIVTPRPWQIVEPGERVYARALLATSGAGTVVGTWMLDGVPFDRFTRVVSGGYPAEVRSTIPIPSSFTGERRLELSIESPGTVPSGTVPFLQATASRSALRILSPEDGGFVDPVSPIFRWTLVPGASGYEVELEAANGAGGADDAGGAGDATDPIAVHRRVTDTEWRPEAELLDDLGPGAKRFRVRAVFPGEVFDDPTPWLALAPSDESSGNPGEARSSEPSVRLASFGTAAPSTPAPLLRGESGAPQQAPPGGELLLALQGSVTATESSLEAPPSLARLQASSQLDVRGPSFDLQSTADLAGSHDLDDPWDGREEGRNWLVRLGATQPDFRQEATVGFMPPSFFDQTEFLTVMSAGGALQGTFDSPAGSLSYYRSVDLSGNESFAGFEPEVDAAAYELSDDGGRYLFRTMLLRATDPGIEGFSAGGEGRGIGVLGTYDFGPRLRLVGEAAAGDFDPAEGSFQEERDGRAFRLSADGRAGAFGYGLTVGRTGEGFVNPANSGFTPGGVSDRTLVEARVDRTFGQATLGGTYRHVRGGIALAAGDPGAVENGGSLSFSMPISQRVSFNLGANLSEQSGDPVEEFLLPATDRTQKGLDLSVTEVLGPVSLTQALTWQDFSDSGEPLNDQQVTGLSLFAGGAPTPFLTVSANVASTRIESAPELGTTDQFLVSLQPSLTVAKLWLELSPRVAFTRVDNDALGTEMNTDQYQLVARWSPRWVNGLIAVEIGGDWSRTWSELDPDPPGFDRQIVFTLTLNWQLDRSWPGSDTGLEEPALQEAGWSRAWREHARRRALIDRPLGRVSL